MNGTSDYQQAQLLGLYTEGNVISGTQSSDEDDGLHNHPHDYSESMTTTTAKDAMEEMMDAKIKKERKARLQAGRATKEEFNSRIQEARTEFNKKLEAERTARIEAERRVVELTEELDAAQNARIDTERRQVTEVAELLKPGVEAFLVEILGVEHEARYDSLMEETNNVRVEQDARSHALQKKFAFLSSEVSTLQDLALRNSSTLDAIVERGDLTDKEVASLRGWMGSMREGHVSLHDAFHGYQHHANGMIAFFLERLTDSDTVANHEDLQDKEDCESPVQDSPGSVAHDPRGSGSSLVDSDSLSDDSEGSESEEEEEGGEKVEGGDDDDIGLVSNHENSPGSESDRESEDEEAADDYSDGEDDPREIDSGKRYCRSQYNWGWVDDDEEGTVG